MALETSPEQPAPVRTIANALSQWIGRLGTIWVEGQMAQLNRRPGTATVFLTLRDSVADISVSVTCARSLVDSMNPPLVEGASVVVHAKPTYYEVRGTLSLQAREIRMIGLGELLAQIERRRQLLAAEGLFDAALKRRLPFLPRTVGLVTSQKSAAERDVLEIARRRWPAVRFRVAHATMQGHRAAAEVMGALAALDRDDDVDVVVIARGGGSVEDLLPFSDEGLLRAVAKAGTPVVSAIGHEPDQPLLDLVADVRAATPTEAAKLVVPDVAAEASTRWRRPGSGCAPGSPASSPASGRRSTHSAHDRPSPTPARCSPTAPTSSPHCASARVAAWATGSTAPPTTSATTAPGPAALSPLATLERGYAVLQDADGHVVTTVGGAPAGAGVSVRVADGRIHATVTDTEEFDAPES